jgi:hypothetical protein
MYDIVCKYYWQGHAVNALQELDVQRTRISWLVRIHLSVNTRLFESLEFACG